MLKFAKLKSRIKKSEGYRNQVYKDHLNNLTIGFGHLVKKNEKFFRQKKYSKKYLINLFEKDFGLALKDLNKNYNLKN